ncbi:hypothetical protein MRB53_002383 [Persea americana]|uniref:Uncharacterized protein n=1 Tax=Persea americana TaxID=3435 RepID=A0ACC2MUC7_PERAE|nr:hypothetical protein MRB53_002383 [Persea americana]
MSHGLAIFDLAPASTQYGMNLDTAKVQDSFRFSSTGYCISGNMKGRDTVQQKQTKRNKSKGKSYHHENGMQDSVNMISGEEQDAGKEDEELVNDPEEAPPSLEHGAQATVDELV